MSRIVVSRTREGRAKNWKRDGEECPKCGRLYDPQRAQDEKTE
jgi:uncharacterized OB-fold protein